MMRRGEESRGVEWRGEGEERESADVRKRDGGWEGGGLNEKKERESIGRFEWKGRMGEIQTLPPSARTRGEIRSHHRRE
jgi:hypothetical protein